MKITRSKTRKGILNWLAKLNPFVHTQVFDSMQTQWQIVAVSIYKDNGEIRCWIDDQGREYSPQGLSRFQSQLAA